MLYIVLLLGICAAAVFIVLILSQPMNSEKPKHWTDDLLSAGGVLGVAILVARLTRMPLAAILTALPFVLEQLRANEQYRQQRRGGTSSSGSGMTREEAALILGVKVNASEEAIKDAHRKLMQKNHPDRGGSDYLAAKINQARDILLSK